jgi:hypothetical protein
MLLGILLLGLLCEIEIGRYVEMEFSKRRTEKCMHALHNRYLERFKNQPTILKRPTPFRKISQLNQIPHRNRRNITPLLPLTHKQPNLIHSNITSKYTKAKQPYNTHGKTLK